MADTPKEGETVTPGASQTPVTTPAPAPAGNASDPAEVERLRKEAEQAQLRVRQLENEKKAREEAEAEAKRKQLAENEEWKTLAEQNQAKLDELQKEREAEQRSNELNAATKEVFAKYPAEVIELAEETGMGLNDVTDEEKAKLTAKLDKIATKVVTGKKVTPNNPANPQNTSTNAELVQRMRAGDRTARAEVISNLSAVKAMRQMAGLGEE